MEELRHMEEEPETTEQRGSFEAEIGMALEQQPDILPSTEFVKVEKNLASLGFFTPSSKRLRNAQEKSFTITTAADGKRMELKGTIIPSAKYGLPITADQDKWIALCKILTDIMRKEGRVTNPIAFTSADILRLLHKHRHSGKNYREVEEWLDVLFSTTIFSEGVVYLANEKRRVKDRYRVFERAVSFGKELSDGKIADKNYVWLSDWQLQNINANHLLPIDLEAYRELKNHIAKALVPLLQVWLYATREYGIYEKRYDELCQMLNIREYPYLSLITRTLAPSLDELTQCGYLADWRIEKTSDDEHYKILFYHGEKFHRDRQSRLDRKGARSGKDQYPNNNRVNGVSSARHRDELRQQHIEATLSRRTFDPTLVAEFTSRGITEDRALKLLANVKPGRDVVAQLEHAEQSVKNSTIEIRNPAGYIARLIELNTPVPDGFETRAQRQAREEREQQGRARRAMQEAEQQLDWDYQDYRASEIERYIEANSAAFEAIKEAKWKADRERFSFTTESMAILSAKNEIGKQIPLLTFEEFLDRRKQGSDFSLKPVAVSPPVETAPATPDVRDDARGESVGDLPLDPTPPATEPEPAMPEPLMIDLASEPIPPPNEIDGSAAANLA
jgi:hypothetical protein